MAPAPVKLVFPPLEAPVRRNEDRRGYETPAGEMTGVTTILGATSSPEAKARLEAWLQRPGAAQESAKACKRGSWVHEQLENHLQGLPVQRHLAFNGYLNSMLPWVEQHVIEPLAMEKPIWHPAGFAGTFDLLAFCADWPEVTLIDWKTSKRARSPDLVDNYLDQLGAYSLGLQHTYDVRPSRGVLVIGRPVGNKPDVWEIDQQELRRREAKFLKRVEQYQEDRDRLAA